MKVTLQNGEGLCNLQIRFSHDQIIPKHSVGGREQHRWHIFLVGKNGRVYNWSFIRTKLCAHGPLPRNVNFLMLLPINVIKKLFKNYVLTESVKSYEMLPRRTTQNKFNKHRSRRKILCNVFQGTYTFLNITHRKILHGGNVTLWDFRWGPFYFNECRV